MAGHKSLNNIHKEKRKRRENAFTYHILSALCFVIVSVLLLSQIDKAYASMHSILEIHQFLSIFKWISLPLGLGLLIVAWCAAFVVKSFSVPITITAWVGFVFLLASLSCFFITWKYGTTLNVLYVVFPCIAIIYLAFYIYPREFFLLSLFISGSSFGLWLFCRLIQNVERHLSLSAGYSIVFGLLFFFSLLLALLNIKDGIFPFGNSNGVRVLPIGSSYKFLWAADFFVFVIVLLSIPFGWIAAWYGVFAVFAFLFVVAVYYTVKMI